MQDRTIALLEARKLAFFATFFVVVLFSYGFLYAIDFIPEAPGEETDGSLAVVSSEPRSNATPVNDSNNQPDIALAVDPLPNSIIFDSLNKEVKVLNPTSSTVADLDEALLSGAVRHPDSADFTNEGNIFILGHSSYLPNVFNKNFQAFNEIQKLVWGDLIRLRSSDTEYIYRVERVFEAKASDVVVPMTPGEAKLTLATCDSFGSKDDRFIVEAELIDTKPI